MQLNGPICKPASRYQFDIFDASSRMRFLSAIMLTAFGMLMAVLFESAHGDWTSAGLSFRKANGFNRIVGESDEQMPVLSNVRKRFYCMHVSTVHVILSFVIITIHLQDHLIWLEFSLIFMLVSLSLS